MAQFVDELNAHPTLMSKVSAMFAALQDSQARLHELQRLGNMSEAQLQEQGLRREDIVSHVYGQ